MLRIPLRDPREGRFAQPGGYAGAVRWLALGAVLVLLSFADGRLDLALSGLFYDRALGDFPWHRDPWVQQVLYVDGKRLMIAVDLLVVGLVVAGVRRDFWSARIASASLTGMFLIPLVIALLKASSLSHCPWDLAPFGGPYAHLSLLAWPQGPVPAGHCLPAGHPSAALSLLGVVLPMAVAGQRRLAGAAAAAALVCGTLTGLLRIAQGAHFPSHVLWSFWVSIAVALAVARAHRLPWQGISRARHV